MMDFPELYSDRLVLRRVLDSDAATVLQGYSDPRVFQFMSVEYHNLVEVKAQLDWYENLFLQKTGIWWGICLKSTGDMIGNGGFHRYEKHHRCAELGYWILPEFQKLGYASEAILSMLDYGFGELELHRVEAVVESENVASSRLLSKIQFSLEGTRRECEIVNGKFINLEIWSMLENEKRTSI